MVHWHTTFSSHPLRACWRKVADLPLGIIADQHILVHLSFDPHRHQQAKARLSQAGWPVTEELPAPQLLELLACLAAGHPAPTAVSCSAWFCDQGTPFQQRVWRLLATIPRGTTQTYGELARRLGNPGLARAVGNACHRNPLALVLPCHRVVAASSTGGFAGPARIKQLLLLREKRYSPL